MNKSGLGCIILFVAILSIGITLYTTCPTTADHHATLNKVVDEVIDDRINQENNLMGNVIHILGKYAMGQTADVVLGQLLHVDNYYVVSIGRIKLHNHERIVSVGILGHVFAPDKEDLEAEIDKYFK